MPYTRIAFDSYKIGYYSPEIHFSTKAQIDCYQGNKRVAGLAFFDDPSLVTGPKMSGDCVSASFLLSRFSDVLDILRNEGPLDLLFSPTLYFQIASRDKEPVGENE